MNLTLAARSGAREVEVDDLGSGPALVLVHGGPGLDRTYFRPWFDEMTRSHRVVSWDLSRTGERSVDAWSGELFEVMDALAIERADVLGHSFGTTVAALAALAEPDRVRSLALVSPPSLGPNENQLARVLARGTREQIATFLGPPAATQAAFDVHWRTMLPLYFADVRSPFATDLAARSVDLAVHREGVSSLDRSPLVLQLPRILSRTLVCCGEHDWLSDAAVMNGWRSRIPNAAGHVFERSAHFPFMEEPSAFFGVLRAFLAG